MKINEYIAKHGLKQYPGSDVEPDFVPVKLYGDIPLTSPTEVFRNDEKTIYVLLRKDADQFRVYEKKTGRVIDWKTSKDCPGLA